MVGESQEAVGAGVGGSSGGSNKMPTLEEYGTNLTRQAEEVRGIIRYELVVNRSSIASTPRNAAGFMYRQLCSISAMSAWVPWSSQHMVPRLQHGC